MSSDPTATVSLNVITGAQEAGAAGFLPNATDFRLANNPAYGLAADADSRLSFIFAIIAAGLFGSWAISALFNLTRDKLGVHVIILFFALERVATYVVRALIYDGGIITTAPYLIFEILEAAGSLLIFLALYHLWSSASRSQASGKGVGRGCGQTFMVLVAFVASAAAVGLFIAGAVFQDRLSSTDSQFDMGTKFRKAAVIGYGGILVVLDLLCLMLCLRKGARAGGLFLLVCSALLSAKAGFQIYAIWEDVSLYYKLAFFWPFLVLTELIVLLFITSPSFAHRCHRPTTPLPITDQPQYIAGGGSAYMNSGGAPPQQAPYYQPYQPYQQR